MMGGTAGNRAALPWLGGDSQGCPLLRVLGDGQAGREGHSQPFPLRCSVYKPPQCYLKDFQDQEVWCVSIHFFLLFGEAFELVERAMDGQRGVMEQSHPRSETR